LPENDSDYKRKLIKRIIVEKKPESVKQLIFFVHKESGIPEKEIFFAIQDLHESKEIFFDELKFPESVSDYIFSIRGAWYWAVMFVSALTVFLVFSVPEDSFPQIYARNFLGLIFVLYLPGYALIKTLYPVNVPLKTRYLALDTIERIALGLGLSLAMTPLVGLILYYSPLGLNLAPISFSLYLLTIFFATSGILREYQARKAMFLRRIISVTDYEIVGNTLRFFALEGLIKKRRIVKEILISEISDIESSGSELSVTSNGIAHIFYVRNRSLNKLRDKIREMLSEGTL
jgi:hypothetical protein